jgi:hypothetical protein
MFGKKNKDSLPSIEKRGVRGVEIKEVHRNLSGRYVSKPDGTREIEFDDGDLIKDIISILLPTKK